MRVWVYVYVCACRGVRVGVYVYVCACGALFLKDLCSFIIACVVHDYHIFYYSFQIEQLTSKAASAEEYMNKMNAQVTATQSNLQDQLVSKK